MARKPKTNRRRLSPLRLIVVLALVAGAVWGLNRIGRRTWRTLTQENNSTWFAPYVDVTLSPTYHFEDPLENPAESVVLSFLVADPTDGCIPSWGAFYRMDEASRSLDFDRRIARYRERGGSVVISFGGLLNDELARKCTDSTALQAAYQSVIDRYGATVLDFDIEGEALADTAANARRATALANLQNEATARKAKLDVWLTLPVDVNGMTEAGVGIVDTTLAGNVNLAGVNAMTMNYGGSRVTDQSMHSANVDALNATFRQLSSAYRRAGIELSSDEVWNRVGATPMIGQNDVREDRFTTKDAERLRVFATERKLGRVSMWSANRDAECGAQLDEVRVSNTCSGVEQRANQFSFEFGVLEGRVNAGGLAPAVRVATRKDGIRDDSDTSPYPVWRTTRTYEQGTKVVWHQNVYEAKWWNQADEPDKPVKNLWDTPWRYLGPVLKDEPPVRVPDDILAKFKDWNPLEVYNEGEQIRYNGKVYESRWQQRDIVPNDDPDTPSSHPWKLLDPASLR